MTGTWGQPRKRVLLVGENRVWASAQPDALTGLVLKWQLRY